MMNPFMYLPYHANAKELQNEWIEIREKQLYNRRGLSNDEYLMVKEGKIEVASMKGILIDRDREMK